MGLIEQPDARQMSRRYLSAESLAKLPQPVGLVEPAPVLLAAG